MNKKLLIALLALSSAISADAQISITASDMPVNGDKLLYSVASLQLSAPHTLANLTTTTGASTTWDYSFLTPAAQNIDTYKTAVQAGYIGGGIALTAFGYKIADTLSFPGAPVSAQNVYTFFNSKTGPSRFVAEGFGAAVSGFPIAAGYSNEDTIYTFPLTYTNGTTTTTTTFKLTASLSGFGSLKQQGTRMRVVDGWGTIKTPYFTTPVNAIRVRSDVNETDTLTFAGTAIPVPRHYVEYKWLVNGEHYPALFVTSTILGANETPTSVRYRDMQRLGTGNVQTAAIALEAFPNPVSGSEVRLKVPASWIHYTLQLYDMAGRLLASSSDRAVIATAALPSGKYVIIANNGEQLGLAQFVR